MPLKNYYTDGYIASQVNEDREERAAEDVAQYGTLPVNWVQRLTMLRAYIITCLECAKNPEDMWSVKLGFYRKEFDSALQQARAAQSVIDAQNNSASSAGIFTIPLLRG